MPNELKPCPVCGSTYLLDAGVEHLGGKQGYIIICADCHLHFERKNKRKAIKDWNRRSDNG